MCCCLFDGIFQAVYPSIQDTVTGRLPSVDTGGTIAATGATPSWHSFRQDGFLLEAKSCHCEFSALWLDWLVDVLLLLALDEEEEDNDGDLECFLACFYESTFSLPCCCLCLTFHVEMFLWISSVNGNYDSPWLHY